MPFSIDSASVCTASSRGSRNGPRHQASTSWLNAWLGLLDGFQEERAAASALMASRMSDTVMFNEVIA